MSKGTRLNEARYFRLPSPHMRKRMTMIRVIPRVPDSEPGRFRAVQVATSCPNPGRRTARDRGKAIESKQSSVEIALVTCHGFENVDQDKEGCQDICLETEVIDCEPSNDPPPSTQQEDVSTIIQNNSGKSTVFTQEEDDQCRQSVREIVRNEKSQDHVEHSCQSVDRKQNRGDRVVKIEKKEERCSNWWKDGGQTILHFFARILGKRVGMDVKGPVDRVSPIDKRVKCVSRGTKNLDRYRRDINVGARLKRVDNGYIVPNHVHRNERSRQATAGDKSGEEQHRPSILVRQIQRTRDKNLRIMLLERELRIRSSKKDTRLTANGANVRQLSSPLC